MEQFVAAHVDVLIQLVIFIVLGAIGFDRLRTGQKNQAAAVKELSDRGEAHWKKLDDRISSLEEKLEKHVLSVSPHQSCVGHQTALMDFGSRMDHIQKGIARLESWIMHIATGSQVAAHVNGD